MKTRILLYALGAASIAYGLRGIVTNANIELVGWAIWYGGAAVLHDAVVAPVVFAVGALTTLLPVRYRRPVRVALITTGALVLVALPLVLGPGRLADNPSVLPLPYGRNLAIVLVVIALLTAVAIVRRKTR